MIQRKCWKVFLSTQSVLKSSGPYDILQLIHRPILPMDKNWQKKCPLLQTKQHEQNKIVDRRFVAGLWYIFCNKFVARSFFMSFCWMKKMKKKKLDTIHVLFSPHPWFWTQEKVIFFSLPFIYIFWKLFCQLFHFLLFPSLYVLFFRRTRICKRTWQKQKTWNHFEYLSIFISTLVFVL